MTKEICESTRIVYYWMTREERDNNPELKIEYRNWKKQGYKVCTFLSGRESLVDLTKDLLKHNKEVIAKQNATQSEGSIGDNLSFFIDIIATM